MNVGVFSTRAYDRRYLDAANQDRRHALTYYETHLTRQTVGLAEGLDAVCVFVNDTLDAPTLAALAAGGTRVIALRCAGFNNVDLAAAETEGLTVVRVPAYSPYAVAEHAVALMLGLNRKLCRAHNRVREGNFSLEGLLGRDIHGQTVGVIGTGRIGRVFARIMQGFGCRVLAVDARPDEGLRADGVRYDTLDNVLGQADILSLHLPLTPETRHLIDARAVAAMKPGVTLINTSRGAIVDAGALIAGLKSGHIGAVGLDVYEEEGDLFFEDLSNEVIQDDVFARLTTFPNVLITGHQAFFTREALAHIAETTLANLDALEAGEPCANRVTVAEHAG